MSAFICRAGFLWHPDSRAPLLSAVFSLEFTDVLFACCALRLVEVVLHSPSPTVFPRPPHALIRLDWYALDLTTVAMQLVILAVRHAAACAPSRQRGHDRSDGVGLWRRKAGDYSFGLLPIASVRAPSSGLLISVLYAHVIWELRSCRVALVSKCGLRRSTS